MKQLLLRLSFLAALAAPFSVQAGEPAATATGVVNPNVATPEELQRLPGIGAKKAAAIVEHRRQHPLRRIDDLAKIKGIGRKTVQRLRPYLTMMGPTTLRERPARIK